jgi:hypothetical protein
VSLFVNDIIMPSKFFILSFLCWPLFILWLIHRCRCRCVRRHR